MAVRGARSAVRSALDAFGQGLEATTGMSKTGLVFSGYAGFSGYKRSREEGSGALGSFATGMKDAFLVDVLGLPLYLTLGAATWAPKGATAAFQGLEQQARSMSYQNLNRPFQNATFVDSQQNYTMRQAGMQMVEKAKYNLQSSMLGNEAQHLHR